MRGVRGAAPDNSFDQKINWHSKGAMADCRPPLGTLLPSYTPRYVRRLASPDSDYVECFC
jgi:hypothetical protein